MSKARMASVFRPRVEPLEDRTTPAVTATFAAGTLTVNSDNASDTITITASLIVDVNGNPVPGGILPSSVTSIFVNGNGGNDTIDLRGVTKAQFTALTTVLIDGGDGDDIIFGSEFDDDIEGGLGNDGVTGGPGNDRINLGLFINLGGVNDGDDINIWNNGDGSDTIQGGTGEDLQIVNGNTTLGDTFIISRDLLSNRLLFRRNDGGAGLGGFTLDIGTVELLTVDGLGGNDSMTVQDLTGITSLTRIDLFGGDGDDTLDASVLPAGVLSAIQFIGGAGNDMIQGSQGVDDINAGAGNDEVVGNRGDDIIDLGDGSDTNTWNNGDGSDRIEGGGGTDDLQIVNGNDTLGDSFVFDKNADGTRLKFDRLNGGAGLGAFNLDIAGIEVFVLNTLGGNDTVTINPGLPTFLTEILVATGDGDDSVVASPQTSTLLNLNGEANTDTLTIIPSGATGGSRSSTATSAQFNYSGRQPIQFANFERIIGGVPVSQSTTPLIAVGSGRSGPTSVSVINADGSTAYTIPEVFPSFTGGVRTAMADVNGDGVPDVIAATGPGGVTRIRIFDGATKTAFADFQPFENAFTGGLYVAAGDLNGDGKSEVFVTPDEGGGPVVIVYRGDLLATGKNADAQLFRFLGIKDEGFRGGARAGLSDVNGDGTLDLLVAAGFGGGPRVAVFNGVRISLQDGEESAKLFGDFVVFEPTLRDGVFITGGDIDGDGFGDVVVGGGPGGGPRVNAISGKGLIGNQTNTIANFFAGNPNTRGGIRLVVKDLDGDSRGDIIGASGTDAPPAITRFKGSTTQPNGTPDQIGTPLNPFDPNYQGGVFVG